MTFLKRANSTLQKSSNILEPGLPEEKYYSNNELQIFQFHWTPKKPSALLLQDDIPNGLQCINQHEYKRPL